MHEVQMVLKASIENIENPNKHGGFRGERNDSPCPGLCQRDADQENGIEGRILPLERKGADVQG